MQTRSLGLAEWVEVEDEGLGATVSPPSWPLPFWTLARPLLQGEGSRGWGQV